MHPSLPASLTHLPAPAKINLFLHVIGRRTDGYHLLQSVFVLLDWADTIHLECRADGQVHRHDLGAALPPDDLCLRAARALREASGTALGADISIDKQVPWGAGLGGGSSDAATVLLGLNRLWRLHWPRPRLAALALGLGADVPFFIGGTNALAQGIGEQLTPITLAPHRFVLVKPPAAIATAAIFSSPLLTRNTDPAIVAGLLADMQRSAGVTWPTTNVEDWLAATRNDLQPAAEALCPEVAEAVGRLERRFGNGRMTGSGSAVFASIGTDGKSVATEPEGVSSWAKSANIADFAQDLPAGWVGRLCRSLHRHPLSDWAGETG